MRRIAYITASWEDESGTRERVFDDELLYEDVSYWILYDGKNVYVYQGEVGNKDVLYISYAGTSGGKDYQNAKYQHEGGNSLKGISGPLPEGEYKINLSLDPRRFATFNGQMEPNANNGIEVLRNEKTGYVNAAWGGWRARLEIVNVDNPSDRNNFYFHDSYKGYSHGCIETETPLYYFLTALHDADYTSITVIVKYSSPTASTNGGTATIPYKLPPNIQKLIGTKYIFPKGHEPGKNNFYIIIPPKPYEFEK